MAGPSRHTPRLSCEMQFLESLLADPCTIFVDRNICGKFKPGWYGGWIKNPRSTMSSRLAVLNNFTLENHVEHPLLDATWRMGPNLVGDELRG